MLGFLDHLDVILPPDVVFDRLADMQHLHRWNPNVRWSRLADGRPLEVGARYEALIARGPVRLRASPTLDAVEPGRTVRYTGRIGPTTSTDTLLFEPIAGGTRITFRNDLVLPRWLTPVAPLLVRAFRPQARRAVRGAERYLSIAR